MLNALKKLKKNSKESKNFLILGLGGIGYHLAKRLLDEDYSVTVIEADPDLVRHADDNLDARIINGSAMSIACWQEAAADQMDYMIAVTDNDAVNMMTSMIADKFGIACKFDGDGQGKSLPEEVQILLFRCIRELLMNVRKHARAQTVSIIAKKGTANYTVTVADDGIGFDSSDVTMLKRSSGSGGFGLFSITERLNYRGGAIEIDSEIKKGTSIILTIPLCVDKICEDGEEVGY